MTNKIVVFSTCADRDEATRIARHLLERRVAACVNILPGIQSLYWWQGKIEESPEFLLLIKTDTGHLEALQAEMAAVHSYEVPELLALPVLAGSPAYLAWLDAELAGEGLRPVPES